MRNPYQYPDLVTGYLALDVMLWFLFLLLVVIVIAGFNMLINPIDNRQADDTVEVYDPVEAHIYEL